MSEPIDFESAFETILEQQVENDDHERSKEIDEFHASDISNCTRRAYLRKYDLLDHSSAYGSFAAGTLYHEFAEEYLPEYFSECKFEIEGEARGDGNTFLGRADMLDPDNNVVIDLKTRAGWYNFDPPTPRHVDQLHVYMRMFGYGRARIVYMSRKDFDLRVYPEDGYVEFDYDRWSEIVERATAIRESVEEYGVAESEDEIPFEKCDNWLCSSESLSFD